MIISEKELSQARTAWGDGLTLISKTYDEQGIDKTTEAAKVILNNLYGFEFGPILFKPTFSSGDETFRTNLEGTLSYFVGHNSKYSKDTGFGLKSWQNVKSETSSIFIENNTAMWMGWVIFTNRDGVSVKVDKSWGYKKTKEDVLKIVLHHSSLPYEV